MAIALSEQMVQIKDNDNNLSPLLSFHIHIKKILLGGKVAKEN